MGHRRVDAIKLSVHAAHREDGHSKISVHVSQSQACFFAALKGHCGRSKLRGAQVSFSASSVDYVAIVSDITLGIALRLTCLLVREGRREDGGLRIFILKSDSAPNALRNPIRTLYLGNAKLFALPQCREY